jgi:hypothetical protein
MPYSIFFDGHRYFCRDCHNAQITRDSQSQSC